VAKKQQMSLRKRKTVHRTKHALQTITGRDHPIMQKTDRNGEKRGHRARYPYEKDEKNSSRRDRVPRETVLKEPSQKKTSRPKGAYWGGTQKKATRPGGAKKNAGQANTLDNHQR